MQDAFQRAIAAGQPAQGGLGPERLADAFFGLGESLQCCAEEVSAACAALPDDRLSRAAEAAAQQAALELLERSVTAFQQARAVPPSRALQTHRRADQANGKINRSADQGTVKNASKPHTSRASPA